MHSLPLRITLLATTVCCLMIGDTVCAQFGPPQEKTAPTQPSAEPKTPVEIADEPKTIDPATLVPPPLAAPVTVKFDEATLKEVVTWLQTEQKLGVVLHQSALKDDGILVSEPVSDQLREQPLYMLLDRLSALNLGWYMEAGLLHITTITAADEHMPTISYNLGDLFDAGYESDELLMSIQVAGSGQWDDVDGVGGQMVLLGDVLFVRQTDKVHREVAGLLAALRKHGRRTFTLDAPQHAPLREKLLQPVSVDFQETPLSGVAQELSRLTDADIRLDAPALKDEGIRERTPITLKLAEQKVSTVLRVLLTEHGLDWVLQDGVLRITTATKADEIFKSAVYDVRDLSRDNKEAAALQRAVRSQTNGHWEATEGVGGDLTFARPGVMVVRQTERVHDEVLQLLENYRMALRASKPRKPVSDPEQALITRYYRLPAPMANELETTLMQLVQPDSWKTPARPEAAGVIRKSTSRPGLLGSTAQPSATGSLNGMVLEHSVLIIRQTRAVHREIGELIQKLETGDPLIETSGGMGGGGMGGAPAPSAGGFGGGGFGGGFPSVRPNAQ